MRWLDGITDSMDMSLSKLRVNGNPLQYSCLENPMDGGAWWAIVHGVTKSWLGCVGPFQYAEWAVVKRLTDTDPVVDQALNDQQSRK